MGGLELAAGPLVGATCQNFAHRHLSGKYNHTRGWGEELLGVHAQKRGSFMPLSTARRVSLALLLLAGVSHVDSMKFGGTTSAGKTGKKQVWQTCKLQCSSLFLNTEQRKLHTGRKPYISSPPGGYFS